MTVFSFNRAAKLFPVVAYRAREGLRRAHKIALLAAHPSYREAARRGVYAAVEHEELFSQFRFDTILDVGANVGQFAVTALACAPSAVVHSFEPIQQCFTKLDRLRECFSSLHCYPFALGEEPGRATINVAANLGSSSILPFSPLQDQVYPGTGPIGREEITIETLDHVVESLPLVGTVLLKLDVQGFELNVLRGGLRMLERVDFVYLEGNFVAMYDGQPLITELIRLLDECNFSLRSIYNIGCGTYPTQVQADFLFCRTH